MSGTISIEVSTRTLGGRPAEPDLDRVTLELLDARITVAELIRRTVDEQVRDLVTRRKLDRAAAQRALDRHYLTPYDVDTQAATGAIRFPSGRQLDDPSIVSERQVRRALAAFENGAYFITVDGHQVTDLTEEVSFAPGANVVFFRLIPLVGG